MSSDGRSIRARHVWILALLLSGLSSGQLPGADPVITEFLASNAGGLQDEDGDSSDWIEVHNPGSAPLPLEGWRLTDERGRPSKWRFPAVTLPPGGYLLVFASGKDRAAPGAPLHANFRLDSGGEYLALVRPDGAVSQEFAPTYPRQLDGVSFGIGEERLPGKLVAAGAPARVLVPPDGALGLRWTGGAADEPFDDSPEAGWTAGSTGVGYDRNVGELKPLGYWDFDDPADPALAPDSSGGVNHGTITSHFALSGTGGRGVPVYTADGTGHSGLPGDRALDFGRPASGALVKVAAATRGAFDPAARNDAVTLSLWVLGGPEQPADGIVFWGSSSPDGTGTRSLNAHIPWSDGVIYFDTAGCCDGTQRISRPEPDQSRWKGRWNHYVFVKDGDTKEIWQNGSLFHQGTNTANLTPIRGFFIGGPLNNGSWSYAGSIDDFAMWDRALSPSQIQALAQGASPLALSSLSPLIGTDLEANLRGKSASALIRIPFQADPPAGFNTLLLRMKHDDGFIAYLNGVEVARRNAPPTAAFDSAAATDRPRAEALVFEEIALPGATGLLRPGANVLAIHGLNDSAASLDFLVLPELLLSRIQLGRYLSPPTPGGPNGPGAIGFVEDTSFSVDRGFYTEPLVVEISTPTPDADIWYSMDGSEPAPGKPGALRYAGPLTVNTTTTLRAAAFKEGHRPTDVDTQTYLFLEGVKRQPARPPGLPATWSGGFPADYEVDPEVVNTALPGYRLEDALLSIPTVSLTLEPADLFGAAGGIYSNSLADWERPASMEWIDPRGGGDFRVNAGARIHGYTSRDNSFTPKHSFRVIFKGRYGPTRLEFPLFPDSDLERFDQVVLRGMSTDSWPVSDGWPGPGPEPLRWYRERAQYLREQWMKDSQVAMGNVSSHGAFVHLYLNGLYWGLYNLTERPTDSFQAGHRGGEREEYDVLKDFSEVQGGDGQAWNEMMALASAGLSSEAAYQRIQGNSPNGARNPAFPVYLDVDNLIDYMILHIYAGADDWPDHNWWTARRRGPLSGGFQFFAWDQEITNNSLLRTNTSWGTRFEDVSAAGPAFLYSKLRASPSFRLRFADRVHKHLSNRGALTPEANDARWMRRAGEVDRAIVGESARWGDSKRTRPYKREVEWLTEQRWFRNVYWKGIHPIALERFRRVGLVSEIPPPALSRHGGRISPGLEVFLTAPRGTIHYTLDGSDPRRPGGTVSPGALTAGGGVPISGTGTVKARALEAAKWSALTEAFFFADIPLRITEIMYHPPAPPEGSPYSAEDFEFLEVQNIGARTLELDGIRMSGAVGFDFSSGEERTLSPGGVAVVVRDLGAFISRYDPTGIAIAGIYSGELSNAGERISLTGPRGEPIHDFRYEDTWQPGTDGPGRSLVIRNARAGAGEWAVPESWRPSEAQGGSPGTDEGGLLPPEGRQLPGDWNQDSRLDLSDAVGLLFALFLETRSSPPCEGPLGEGGNRALLDGNGDSGVDVSDAVHLLRHLFLGGPGHVLGGGCVAIPGCGDACGQ